MKVNTYLICRLAIIGFNIINQPPNFCCDIFIMTVDSTFLELFICLYYWWEGNRYLRTIGCISQSDGCEFSYKGDKEFWSIRPAPRFLDGGMACSCSSTCFQWNIASWTVKMKIEQYLYLNCHIPAKYNDNFEKFIHPVCL